MLENSDPMKSAVFQVDLHQKSNNLRGSVQVISLTSSHAKMFVRRMFFTGEGWEITKVTKIRVVGEE